MRATRRYRLAPGLRDVLALLVEHRLEPVVQEWRKEIESGEISGELREVLVAIGWVTHRDTRLESLNPIRRSKSKESPSLEETDPDGWLAQYEVSVSDEALAAGGLSPEPEETLIEETPSDIAESAEPLISPLRDPEVDEPDQIEGGGPKIVTVGPSRARKGAR